MTRTAWANLPAAVRRAVEAHTGPITAARDVPGGFTCATAAILETVTGTLFIKGVPEDDAEGRAAQAREAVVNPIIAAAGPYLHWHVQATGWDLLAFEHIDGRHSDLSPGSADLPLVSDVVQKAAVLVGRSDPLPDYADRLAPWLNDADPALLDGHHLLHTDTNPHNILVTPSRAWLVDWAMPARGPAWVEVAYTAVRLMEAGHTGAQAHAWAEQIPAWRDVTPEALSAWVTAHCRQWAAEVGPEDAETTNTRYRALLS